MVIYQPPNPPIIITMIAFVIALLTQGLIHTISVIIFALAGLYWSYLEIKDPASPARRVFGILGVIGVLGFIFIQLL